MSEQQNVKTVQAVYAAFGRGDVAFIVGQLTDDVRWVSHFDAIVPWGGNFSGKDQIHRFFEAIFQSVDVEAFEPKEWIAEADTGRFVGSVWLSRPQDRQEEPHAMGLHLEVSWWQDLLL